MTGSIGTSRLARATVVWPSLSRLSSELATPGPPPAWLRRLGLGGRLHPQSVDLGAHAERGLPADGQRRAELPGHLGERAGQRRRRDQGQEVIVEVGAQLGLVRGGPARITGPAVPGQHPAHLTERGAWLAGPGVDGMLQHGPAGQAVLPGDGQLRVVQRAELTGGQPPFGLQLEEAQIGPAGECARLLGHGSPSFGARGFATSGWKDMPSAGDA